MLRTQLFTVNSLSFSIFVYASCCKKSNAVRVRVVQVLTIRCWERVSQNHKDLDTESNRECDQPITTCAAAMYQLYPVCPTQCDTLPFSLQACRSGRRISIQYSPVTVCLSLTHCIFTYTCSSMHEQMHRAPKCTIFDLSAFAEFCLVWTKPSNFSALVLSPKYLLKRKFCKEGFSNPKQLTDSDIVFHV